MHMNMRDLAHRTGWTPIGGALDIGHMIQDGSDIKRAEPLLAELAAKSEAGVAEAAGTLIVKAEFVCSRCLSAYGQKVEIPFRERFARSKSNPDAEDDDLHLVNEDIVDLKPYIEESVLLGLPYIPLCDEACKGLNPETGANLNIDPAAVPEARIDPRLAVLQQLLDKGKSDL